MKKSFLCTTLVSALLATSTVFAAEAKHFYIGAGLGGTTVKDALSASEFDAKLESEGYIATSSVDDTDTGWKLYGGYTFSKNFAIEANYTDLGELSVHSNVNAPFIGNILTTWEAKTFAFSALGILPLAHNFELFGKAGVHYWDAKLTRTASAGGGLDPASKDDKGTDLLYGFGAAYNFTKQFALRADWERYRNIGDDNSAGESDVDMWSAGIQYTF